MTFNNAINRLTLAEKQTTFTTSGIWTKDPNAIIVRIFVWGGGGGGGSGRRGISGMSAGGGGGSGGSACSFESPASFFDATESITIGLGGAGGLAQTIDSSNGNDGSPGGDTTLGPVIVVPGGAGGSGGGNISGGGGISLPSFSNENFKTALTLGSGGEGKRRDPGANGQDVSDPLDSSILSYVPSGGGGGGGARNTINYNGGTGGLKELTPIQGFLPIPGGTAGISDGVNGGNGSDGGIAGGFIIGGSGGGGGGGMRTTAPSNGGHGGLLGGAGGAGGGSLNGTNSGAGGNGANGFVVIVEFI